MRNDYVYTDATDGTNETNERAAEKTLHRNRIDDGVSIKPCVA